MGIFDIPGPVMVGPSSSHRWRGPAELRPRCWAAHPEGRMALHGSFAATGEGHRPTWPCWPTAGAEPDDERIRRPGTWHPTQG